MRAANELLEASRDFIKLQPTVSRHLRRLFSRCLNGARNSIPAPDGLAFFQGMRCALHGKKPRTENPQTSGGTSSTFVKTEIRSYPRHRQRPARLFWAQILSAAGGEGNRSTRTIMAKPLRRSVGATMFSTTQFIRKKPRRSVCNC